MWLFLCEILLISLKIIWSLCEIDPGEKKGFRGPYKKFALTAKKKLKKTVEQTVNNEKARLKSAFFFNFKIARFTPNREKR